MRYMDLKDDIRPLLDNIDWKILRLLDTRASLVKEVARAKKREADAKGEDVSLQAASREAAMFSRLEMQCRVLGLDFDYISELWSLMIWHAKQMECDELKDELKELTFMDRKPADDKYLQKQLLELTKCIAPKYNDYCKSNAIMRILSREEKIVDDIVKGFGNRALAIDLGCGTGRMIEHLQEEFDEIIAFDISEDMLDVAKKHDKCCKENVSLRCEDLSESIPIENGKVSFAIANFGAASEIHRDIIKELHRVLCPGGRALVSFYNKDAFSNKWFYPWPATVKAYLNIYNDTLEVWAAEKVYTVRAWGQTIKDLERKCERYNLTLDYCETYPTVQSIFPKFFYNAQSEDQDKKSVLQRRYEAFKDLRDTGDDIDEQLASKELGVNRGTYITAYITKPQ